MLAGCSSGKYTVVKEITPSYNNTLLYCLYCCGIADSETVYNLTFNYNFTYIPCDLGDIQIHINYSNKNTYKGTIIDKAANTKKQSLKRSLKRSLDDIGGSHKC